MIKSGLIILLYMYNGKSEINVFLRVNYDLD